jgi:hypothetical protein
MSKEGTSTMNDTHISGSGDLATVRTDDGGIVAAAPFEVVAGYTVTVTDAGSDAEAIEALLAPVEPTYAELQAQVEQANTVNVALSAELNAQRLDSERMVREANRARVAAVTELDRLKENVVEAVKGARKEHDLCIDGCNSFLEGLGLPTISKAWTVTVTRDNDGETILTVTGVEADDEYAAREEVRSNFTISATVNQVTYEYGYDGEGEADFDTQEYVEHDDEDDDSYADNHKDNLSFSAEEE